MIEFGKTLCEARERKGLTLTQIAERTHMLVQQVEDLENERFTRIPAPIYGRGFVKLYCEAVDLDPQPLVAAFMALYNGKSAGATGTIASAAAVAAEEGEGDDAMGTIASTAAEPVAPVPPEPQDPLFAFTAEPEADDGIRRAAGSGPSRFAAPTPIDDEPRRLIPSFRIPPVFLRFLALIGGAILILWLLYAGACALVAAMKKPATEAGETPAMREKAPAGETPALQEKARKAIDISPLYID